MSLEVTPVGVACNLACTYCYENPMREAGNQSPAYDLDAIKATLTKKNYEFTLFGGEPLLMKFEDLKDLLEWGFQRHGRTGIQTNGSLITEAHLEVFARCKTHVGLSIDGPGELNDARIAHGGDLARTRDATQRSLTALFHLLETKHPCSLIITLSRMNASRERLPQLVSWLRELDRCGLKTARLHLLEVDHAQVREHLMLTEDENVHALLTMMRLQDELKTLRFDLFREMAKLLLIPGYTQASCVWNGCDPLTTPAVQAVNGHGGLSNCSRTNKDGLDWVKAEQGQGERYLILHSTPQEHGGCKDCRFFFACKGQCPGTAIDGDWRNRSEQCRVWYRLFETIEKQLTTLGKSPVSLNDRAREAAESALLQQWAGPQYNQMHREHGDHWDAPDGYQHTDAGFEVHGDNGMTLTHGDVPHEDHVDA